MSTKEHVSVLSQRNLSDMCNSFCLGSVNAASLNNLRASTLAMNFMESRDARSVETFRNREVARQAGLNHKIISGMTGRYLLGRN